MSVVEDRSDYLLLHASPDKLAVALGIDESTFGEGTGEAAGVYEAPPVRVIRDAVEVVLWVSITGRSVSDLTNVLGH